MDSTDYQIRECFWLPNGMVTQVAYKRTSCNFVSFAAALAALVGLSEAALAQQPTAIVEEIRSQTANVEVFDYLRPGQVVDLGEADLLVLGYLESCLRETIVGGQVVVGQTESAVQSGSVDRKRVECDGGRSRLSAEQASKSGVIVFRSPDGDADQSPPIRIFSASPIFTFTDAVGELVIRRLDPPGESLVLEVRGRTLDLSELGKRLVPGALYEAQAGEKIQTFEVDLSESPIGEALIGRLIRF